MLPGGLSDELAAPAAGATPGFFGKATAVCSLRQRCATNCYYCVVSSWDLSASAEGFIAGTDGDNHAGVIVERSKGLLAAGFGTAVAVADDLRAKVDGCVD